MWGTFTSVPIKRNNACCSGVSLAQKLAQLEWDSRCPSVPRGRRFA